MPELPDIELYLTSLRERIVGHRLNRLRIASPFVLRTFDPAVETVEGLTVQSLQRIGKRIVFEFARNNERLFAVVHLMIAGRFRWSEKTGAKPPAKIGLASFEFDKGTLLLVEPSQKKRASIHIISGVTALAAMNPGGVNVLEIDLKTFTQRIRLE